MAEEYPDEIAELRRKLFGGMSLDHRKSMATALGMEGKFVAKGSHGGKAIAVFTSGGDAQGNSFIIFNCSSVLLH